MAPPLHNGLDNGTPHKMYSLTSLKRWSVANKPMIPDVSQIKAIHVYDFDNTLFSSPLPNPQLWDRSTIGFLQNQDPFVHGGWWHDPAMLMATGEGVDIEEPRAWEGWWNESIVQLVELSMEQKDVVTVLLTGRNETNFADTIKRMVAAKKLDFDLICLKPEVGPNNQRFPTTAGFKHVFLEDLVHTYSKAEDIRVYEDRPKHTQGFRNFFARFNADAAMQPKELRRTIQAEVIQVTELDSPLDPVIEASEIQRMINNHNIAFKTRQSRLRGPYVIRKDVLSTGYKLSSQDSKHLIALANLPPAVLERSDLSLLGDSILIAPYSAPRWTLDKVGGIGKKLKWQVTGLASLESRLWAARVVPLPTSEREQTHTANPVPHVVLATTKGSRPIDATRIQSWQPVPADKALIFETTVAEKVILKIEEVRPGENDTENTPLSRENKRRHLSPMNDENFPPLPSRAREGGQDRHRDKTLRESRGSPNYQPYQGQYHNQNQNQTQIPNQPRRFEHHPDNNNNNNRRNSNNYRGGNQSRGGGRGGSNNQGSNRNGPYQNRNDGGGGGGGGRAGGNSGRGNDNRRGGGGGGRDRRRGGGPMGGYKSLDDQFAGNEGRGMGMDGVGEGLNY